MSSSGLKEKKSKVSHSGASHNTKTDITRQNDGDSQLMDTSQYKEKQALQDKVTETVN